MRLEQSEEETKMRAMSRRRITQAEERLHGLEQRIKRLEAQREERQKANQEEDGPKLYEVGTILHPESDRQD